MTLPIIVIIISVYLESILSNFISANTILFAPLFSLISLIIVFPFLNNKSSNFFYISLILGLLYDIGFTNTLFLNVFLFLAVAYFIKLINIWVSNNVLNVVFITISTVVFYRLLTYFILTLIGYIEFDFNVLIKSIYSSLILNIIYVIVFYHITDYYSMKYKIHKID